MTYLKDLLSKINKQATGISGKQFRELADINKPNSYLPNNHVRYQYCVGSSPQYRGYPCGLWLLFHTLTVSQVESGIYLHFYFLYSSFFFLSVQNLHK